MGSSRCLVSPGHALGSGPGVPHQEQAGGPAGGVHSPDGTDVLSMRLPFLLLVCVLIESLSLSKMPFRGDAVVGKCFSSVTRLVAFSFRTAPLSGQ